MSQKERKKIGHFPGRSDIATVAFINAVREQDRIRAGNGDREYCQNVYSDPVLTHNSTNVNLNEVLAQIDVEGLDTLQRFLVSALQQQSKLQPSQNEDEITRALTMREVYRSYKRTSRFNSCLSHLRQQRRRGVSAEEARGQFAGKVVEDIGYYYFRPRVRHGVLIAPEITEELFLNIYQGNRQINHEYGSRTVDGVSVPDGVVIEVTDGIPVLTQYVEYSLSQDDKKYRNQFASYQTSIENIRYRSSRTISPNNEFVINFVVPRPQWSRQYPNLSGSVQSNFHLLPFDVLNFGWKINEIIAEEFDLSFAARSRSRF